MPSTCDISHRDGAEIYTFKNDSLCLEMYVVCNNAFQNNSTFIGGCRFIEYASSERAIKDAIRLSKAMSFKLLVSGLQYGGGKVVINRPSNFDNIDRERFFREVGRCIESLNGKLITGCDAGTRMADMYQASLETSYITALETSESGHSYLIEATSLGLCIAIERSLQLCDILDVGKATVAIQGVGAVGASLAKRLAKLGSRLIVSDIDEARLVDLLRHVDVQVVSPDAILRVDSDVFSPCALGGVIDSFFVEKNSAKIICGAANNQLTDDLVLNGIHSKGTFYVPDFLANVGGLLYAAGSYEKKEWHQIQHEIEQLVQHWLQAISEKFRKNDKHTLNIVFDLLQGENIACSNHAR